MFTKDGVTCDGCGISCGNGALTLCTPLVTLSKEGHAIPLHLCNDTCWPKALSKGNLLKWRQKNLPFNTFVDDSKGNS